MDKESDVVVSFGRAQLMCGGWVAIGEWAVVSRFVANTFAVAGSVPLPGKRAPRLWQEEDVCRTCLNFRDAKKATNKSTTQRPSPAFDCAFWGLIHV